MVYLSPFIMAWAVKDVEHTSEEVSYRTRCLKRVCTIPYSLDVRLLHFSGVIIDYGYLNK